MSVNEQQRRFVVATHGGFYQFSVGSNLELDEGRLLDDGYHYGATVALNPDRSARIYAYRGGPGRLDELPTEIRVWDYRDDSIHPSSQTPLYEDAGDIHQISTHGREGLLLSNSRLNSIDCWSPETGLTKRFHINGHDTDVNHVNSVFPVGDLVGVMLHNFRKLESQIVLLQDTGSDFKELGRFSLRDWCCHNIGILGHWLYINASSDKSVVKIDLRTLKEAKRTTFDAHTKGLSTDGKYLYAGISDCASRAERVRSRGWLNVLDVDSLELIKRIPLETPDRGSAIGNVNEVRLVSGVDLFDQTSGTDAELFRRSVDVEQNRVAIQCRRTWIRTLDRVRRTLGVVLSR